MGFTKLFSKLGDYGITPGRDEGSAVSTFGEINVVQMTPVAQGDFVHGVNPQVFNTSSFSGGSVTTSQNMAVLNSGASASGSAVVQLRRQLRYKAGQGAVMRATALFETGTVGNAQFIGMGNSESGYFLGYFSDFFGILHSKTGAREIRRLDIEAPVATTENVTIELNGNTIVVPVIGGGNETQTAYQIGLASYREVGAGGWISDVYSGSVYFISARSRSDATGSYSIAGGTVSGSFTRVVPGQNQENDFIPSSLFNIDKLDGTGQSGFILNPQKGNVYQIGFQYLGFGNAKFMVEDPETGYFIKMHEIKNANALDKPVLKNPNVSILATSANIGGTQPVEMKTASMVAYTEGKIVKLDPKYAKTLTYSINSATYLPLGLFKVTRIFNGISCFGNFEILKLGGSNESAAAAPKTLTIGLFLSSKISGDVDFQHVLAGESIVDCATLDPASNTISNLSSITPFYELIVGAGGATTVDLRELDVSFGPGEEVLIAIKTSGPIDGTVSLNWYEQQ
jgi:hypothetical protein